MRKQPRCKYHWGEGERDHGEADFDVIAALFNCSDICTVGKTSNSESGATTMHQHTVHVLICTLPEAQHREPQLRIVLSCSQDKAPNCVQPYADSTGYMEDLNPDLIYEGHNVRVEWLDGSDGSRNVVGAYQVQSTSVEKCEVK